MSGPALEWAIKNFPFLRDASEKVILIKLAHRVRKGDDTGLVWAGVDCTAVDTGTSRRSVLRAQKHLEDLGLIRVERRANKTSYIFLQLNFLLELGATMALPDLVGSAIVAPSRCHRGTPAVPSWHPNQTMNQTMNQTQPQQPVVVVEITWEKPLTADEKQSCELVLAGRADAQKFADELAGAARVRPVNNPAGWLRAVVKNSLRPNFCFEHAARVAAARAGQAAQAERESLALPPARLAGVPAPRPAPRELTEVGRASLLAARAVLASPTVGKLQPPVLLQPTP